MKTLFIESKRNLVLDKEKLAELVKILPRTIYIAFSIQYKELARQVKNAIKNKQILGFSQVLGCSTLDTKAEAILLIGESRFHALNLALSGKEVFIFDNYSVNKIDKGEIEIMKKKEKGKYLKFLSSKSVGIIVSVKKGQDNIKEAEKLKMKLENEGKKVFLFVAENINTNELENFPDIEIWVNTACPGLALDSSKIINYRAIKTQDI